MPTDQKNVAPRRSRLLPRPLPRLIPALGRCCYGLLRPLLFTFYDAEAAHTLTINGLCKARRRGLLDPNPAWRNSGPVEVMGLTFPNVVGLAAGMDKAATCVDGFGSLGFGHIEVGTLTPRPQKGNPTPRLFRLREHRALINRLGFNNPGIDAAIENLRSSTYTGILGINIGKNTGTPNERALDDYLICLKAAYPVADYVTVNLSSPNSPGLRELQNEENARTLIQWIKVEQAQLAKAHDRYVPLAVKIAPDLEDDEIDALARVFLDHAVDGVIATNTTIDRHAVRKSRRQKEAGGLSGAPLTARSTEVIRLLNATLKGRIPIIGVGGIMSAQDARDKLDAGARLVQVYTGLVYRGPRLVRDIVKAGAARA